MILHNFKGLKIKNWTLNILVLCLILILLLNIVNLEETNVKITEEDDDVTPPLKDNNSTNEGEEEDIFRSNTTTGNVVNETQTNSTEVVIEEPPPLNHTRKELKKMRVRALKRIISDRGFECKGCVEKSHLVDRALESICYYLYLIY